MRSHTSSRLVDAFALAILGMQVLDAQELEIEREPLPASAWERVGEDTKSGEGLFERVYVSPWKQESMSVDELREVIEWAGVPFPDGGSVKFTPPIRITVVNERVNLELVDAYFESLRWDGPERVCIRTEIYALDQLQVLELLESAEAVIDHTPERNAVLKLVRSGHAELVASHSLITTFGQRAKLEDTVESPVVEGVEEGDEDRRKSYCEARGYGTIFEVEPLIEVAWAAIYLNLSFEHHTAEPEAGPVVDGNPTLHFHAKKVSTCCWVAEGSYQLLSTWKPTGKPEYAERGIMHVLFVTASLQTQ